MLVEAGYYCASGNEGDLQKGIMEMKLSLSAMYTVKKNDCGINIWNNYITVKDLF